MKSSIIKTQQRNEMYNQMRESQIADAVAQQTVANTTKASGMPVSPGLQVMQGVYEQQNRQAQLQAANMKTFAKAVQALYNKPSDYLRAQREQLALQQEAIKKQIQMQQQQQEYAMIAPKETVQDSEQVEYLEPNRVEMLEKIYNGLAPKKKFNMQQLGTLSLYQAPLKDYPGGFVDPNYDKSMRPLGNETAKITEF